MLFDTVLFAAPGPYIVTIYLFYTHPAIDMTTISHRHHRI